jgi:ligand-binding sensor domain-containing protein
MESYSAGNGLPCCANSLLEDHAGRFWVSTGRGAVLLVPDPDPSQPVVARRFGVAKGLSNNIIWNMLEMSDGRIWMSTMDGLAVSNGMQFRMYETTNGLSALPGDALAEDNDGNLWVAHPRMV